MTDEELQEWAEWKAEKKQKAEAEAARKKVEDEKTENDWIKIMNGSLEVVGKVNIEED